MIESKRTKKCKKLFVVFSILHFLFVFGPMIYFIPYAYTQGSSGQKIGLSVFIVAAFCLSLFAIFAELKTRSGLAKTIMWILIVGILFCLKEVELFIYIMAFISIVDELLIARLKDKYKLALSTNKEIDRRQ